MLLIQVEDIQFAATGDFKGALILAFSIKKPIILGVAFIHSPEKVLEFKFKIESDVLTSINLSPKEEDLFIAVHRHYEKSVLTQYDGTKVLR